MQATGNKAGAIKRLFHILLYFNPYFTLSSKTYSSPQNHLTSESNNRMNSVTQTTVN